MCFFSDFYGLQNCVYLISVPMHMSEKHDSLEHGQSELLILCHMITICNGRDCIYKDEEAKKFMGNGVAGL